MFLDWKHLRSAERPPFRQKRKIKKFLTVRKRCGTINESLEAKPFKRKRTSKDKVVLWKLNNATWIICDSSQMFLKTSIDYEHKQSAISLLSFDLSRFRPKKIIRANQGFPKFYGEFDPGSGRTLAACLTHASRTRRLKACFWKSSGKRVSNA